MNGLLYFCGLVSYVIFSATLHLTSIAVNFVTTCLFGFMLGAYTPIAIQLCLEFTYPESEVITTSIFYCSSYLFGIFITNGCQIFIDKFTADSLEYGNYANIVMSCLILPGFLLTLLIDKQLYRTEANVAQTSNEAQS